MRRRLFAELIIIGFSLTSQAALFDRGGGMIYDDVLNITWLQDANQGAGSAFDDGVSTIDGLMTWDSAVAWADNLSFGGFDDWRLASMDVNGDDTIVDCNFASEVACRDHEFGYMFYQNLMGNLGDFLSGDQGLFTNIQFRHWSGTEYAANPDFAWFFHFSHGGQTLGFKPNFTLGAWAVRAGDVGVVPLPGAVWLLGSGLLGLVGFSRRKN